MPDFYADATLEQRWRAYIRSMPPSTTSTSSLADTGLALLRFLLPLADAIRGRLMLAAWHHDSGWTMRDRTS